MSNLRVAKRYAKGLFNYTEETQQTPEIYAEMQSLRLLIAESKDLRNFLNSPILDYKTKESIADQLFASYSNTTQTFIHLVIQHSRERNLGEIANEFIAYSDVKNHVKKATITTAQPLDPSLLDTIVQQSKLLRAEDTIEITQKIDPSIIGGYIFKVGDQQIDASIKSQFNKLKQEFDENYYIPKY